MRLPLVLAATISMTVTVVVLLSSFESKVNAITNVNNTYFSMDIPDNWRYAEHSNTGMAGMAESSSTVPINLVALAPADFAESLVINRDQESPYAKMFNGGAYSTFRQDTDYSNKNSTLEAYVKDRINSLVRGVNLTSQQDTIVGNEKAVRIEGNGIKILKNLEYVAYLVLHDKDPYYLEFIANVKDFQKYLPQFEQMVKTLKFVK